MARIRVKYKGVVVSDLPLASDKEYIVGKKDTCDLKLLPEKGVSREHLRLKWNGQNWEMETLSKYGEVLVKGERVERLVLQHGESFVVPPYEFEYLETSADASATSQSGEDAARAGDKTVVGVANVLPYIRLIDDNNATKELFCLESGESWIAGRDTSAQIEIRDRRVSRRQFEVRRSGAGYTILDLGSANGTLVNGQPISSTDATPLKSGDTITVLNNFLVFELRDPNFKSRAELVSLPPIPLDDNTPAPAPLPSLTNSNYQSPYQSSDESNNPSQSNQGDFFPAAYPGAQSDSQSSYANNTGTDTAENPELQQQRVEKERLKKEKDKKTKTFRLALIVGIVLMGAYFFTSGQKQDDAPKDIARPTDPFEKLTPEKQLMVRQIHQLSLNYLMQGKYDLCFTQVQKIYDHLPVDYNFLDSKDIEQKCKISLEVQEERRRQEEREKAQKEIQEKIDRVLAECRAKMNSSMTQEGLDNCLASIVPFAPEHPAFAEMRAQIEAYEAERKVRLENQAQYRALVARLEKLFNIAKRTEKRGAVLTAIKKYQVVIDAKLPDPKGLKGTSKRKIASIRAGIDVKVESGLKEVEKLYSEQKLKEAILALRDIRKVDPSNTSVKEKIENYTQELKKGMMVMYQEGILEENYGNVEGGENKEGAKDKWKKIMDKDIPDGEYFLKAKIKLRKYGEIKKQLGPMPSEVDTE